MKFLVDAQLPQRLARFLGECGHDAIHTSELPDGNRTSDVDVCAAADADDRVVVTKDADFRDANWLRGTPRRLLVVTVGNIRNDDLLALFEGHLVEIAAALNEARFVELGPQGLVIHGDRG